MIRLLPSFGVLGSFVMALLGQSPAEAPRLLVVTNITGNAEILLMNADGSQSINLTNNQAEDTFPAWSPNGKQIAFTSNRDGRSQIYVMEPDGTEVQRLTTSPTNDRSPAWSPDGKKIAFCREEGGNQEIFVMNADGANPTNVTKNPAVDSDPAWSRDGKFLAFASNRSGDGFHMYVMDADGQHVQQLSEKRNPYGYVYPTWSPDGKTIGYTDVGAGTLELFAHEFANGKKTQLTKLGSLNTQMSWSPDGKQCSFIHMELEDLNKRIGSLYVMAADGTGPKAILKREVPLEGGRPCWKPR